LGAVELAAQGMTPEYFIAYRNIALCAAIIVILWVLAVLLCREWVKRDLAAQLRRPITIQWRPRRTPMSYCGFRVYYIDPWGQVHDAFCIVRWLGPPVKWIEDEIAK
jgi:hypothetical protein